MTDLATAADFRARDSAERIDRREAEHFQRAGVKDIEYPQTRAAAVAHARAARAEPTPPGTWYSIGPRNIGGRIIAIAQEPDNPLVFYAGSAHGGLWTTRDAGDTWIPIDLEHSEPVGAIAVARQRPRTLYVGTGSHDPRHISGSGLWKVDVAADPATSPYVPLAGVDAPHVAPASASPGASFRYTRLRVDPDNPDRLWAATQTGLWRREPGAGLSFIRDFPPAAGAPAGTPLLATTIGGLSDIGWPPYCTDLLVAADPRGRERFTEASIDGARYLLLFVAIHGEGVFRGRFDRKDRTVSWDAKRDLPNADLYVGGRKFGRILLAQCASRPEVVYAVFSSQSGSGRTEHDHASFVFRSGDSGDTWARRERIPRALGYEDVPSVPPGQTIFSPGQANFSMVLEADPHNPDVVVCGEVDLCLSTDGAATWTTILDSSRYDAGDFAQHCDQHAVHFDSTDGRRLWVGNDGGVSMARDLRRPPQAPGYWRKRSHGIVAAQFYDVAVHPSPALGFMCGGGLQDSGTFVGFGGRTWYHVGWSDGGAMAFHAGSPDRLIVGADGLASSLTIIDRPPIFDPAFKRLLGLSSPVIPDVPAHGKSMHLDWRPYFLLPGAPLAGGPFLAVLEQDPTVPGQFLLGWTASPAGSLAFVVGPVGPLPPAPPPPPAQTAPAAAAPVTLSAAPTGTLLAPGGIDPGIANEEEATAVALGPLEPGPEVGPPPPPTPPNIVQAWIGTSRGHLAQGNDLANLASFGSLNTSPHSMASIRRAIAAIAVHPQDAFIVAVATVPRTPGLMLWVTVAGATGVARFVVFLQPISFPTPRGPLTPPTGHVHGPFVTGPAVAIPETPCTVRFDGNYVAGDRWEVLPDGRVTPFPGTVNAVTVASSAAQDVTVVIDGAGGVGTATFRTGVGALGPDPAIAAIKTAPRLDLPSSPLILFFSGTFVAGDRFTVTPRGSVAAAPGNSATSRLAARDGNRGHVLLSYDRGLSWQDVTAPAPLPRPDPDLDALPPGPVAALAWDRIAPTRLFAGTLAGIYALADIPSPTALTIGAKPASLPRGTARRLSATLTLTSGGPIDCTGGMCDWTSSDTNAFTVTFDGALATVPGAGIGTKSRIRARRGTLTDFFDVEVAPPGAGAGLPAAGAFVPPNVVVSWRPFNRELPLVLVNDLATLPGTRILRAATFGRGMWDCNLAGDVQQRLYIRQTIVEDGRTYPRVVPEVSAGVPLNDPRLPQAGPSRIALDFTHAHDIRVDAQPFTFFDDVVDGVEFDEQLEVGDPVPTEDNYVYVQVHNAGTTAVPNVSVHLYAAECAAADLIHPIGATATASPPSLDTGAPITGFYGQPGFDPIAASPWKRVDTVRLLDEVPPDAPRVARFTWTPAEWLAGTHVALLALCSGHPLSLEELPVAPEAATLSAFILAERRAALRVVRVAARPAASLFIRDGVADDTRVGGYPVAGRSPDIMVVHPDINQPASEVFKDFLARRTTDSVSSAVTNVVYVRVHNRRKFDTAARVKVYAIGLDDGNRPSSDPSGWKDVPPDLPPILPGFPPELRFAEVDVPASGVAYARIELPAAADPNPGGTNKTYLLLALIKSADDTDLLPTKESVDSVDTFWELVSRYVDSDNAAARAVPWS